MAVPLSDILANNTSLTTANPSELTAVFIGATAGIGLGALQALTRHTSTPTIYIVGRSPTKLASLIHDLRCSNQKATFVPIHAPDLTKVASAQKAAAEIARQVDRVDLLVMSAGYITFAAREEHPSEGIDKITALRYYSRMAFLMGLAPALQAASRARVISVLAGGKEGQLWREDLLLREKGHYGVHIAGGAAASLTTLFFEEVSRRNGWEKIVFAHESPGVVSTDLEIGGLGMIGDVLLKWIARPIVHLVGYTKEEAGERVLFVGTSGNFKRLAEGGEGGMVAKGSDGTVGSGVYLVQGNTGVVETTKEMVKMREDGMAKVVYDHTLDVLAKIEKGERV